MVGDDKTYAFTPKRERFFPTQSSQKTESIHHRLAASRRLLAAVLVPAAAVDEESRELAELARLFALARRELAQRVDTGRPAASQLAFCDSAIQK